MKPVAAFIIIALYRIALGALAVFAVMNGGHWLLAACLLLLAVL